MTDKDSLAHAKWRKSSFSGSGGAGAGNCVEVASLPGDRIAIRDSKHPANGAFLVTNTEMAAWIKGIKEGKFDNLT